VNSTERKFSKKCDSTNYEFGTTLIVPIAIPQIFIATFHLKNIMLSNASEKYFHNYFV